MTKFLINYLSKLLKLGLVALGVLGLNFSLINSSWADTNSGSNNSNSNTTQVTTNSNNSSTNNTTNGQVTTNGSNSTNDSNKANESSTSTESNGYNNLENQLGVKVYTKESTMLSQIINQIPQATNYIRSSIDVILLDASIVDNKYLHLEYKLKCRSPSGSNVCFKPIQGIDLTSFVSLEINDDSYKNSSNLILAIPINLGTFTNPYNLNNISNNLDITKPAPFLSNRNPGKIITVNYLLADLQMYHSSITPEINRYDPNSYELFSVLTKVNKLLYTDGSLVDNATLNLNDKGQVTEEQQELLKDPLQEPEDTNTSKYRYYSAPHLDPSSKPQEIIKSKGK